MSINKTLHLNLKKKWFNMILLGIKKEEYRSVGKYWNNRLNHHQDIETITFSNGYRKVIFN